MKDTEIHKGLDKEDIRVFISECIANTYETINSLDVNQDLNDGDTPLETIINRETYMVNYHTQKLKHYKELNSLLTIMKMFGWKDFDVSDSVIRGSKHTIYRNFIGTDEEYYELTLLLNGEKP